MKLLWLTDLHLDRVEDKPRMEFYKRLRSEQFDAAVITGDISTAQFLQGHLRELGQVCAPKPVYFVLGNHDFYGSSFDAVDRAVADVCKEQMNLRHLGQGEIIPLVDGEALVGHRGWADGRAGWGESTFVRNRDRRWISDFRGLSKNAMFGRMADIGRESARHFREVLPYALQCHRSVWVATHVPPFASAAIYRGKPCDRGRQPHFVNFAAGGVLAGIARQHPRSRLTVLCGHTHSRAQVTVSEQVRVIAGEARKGWPQMQRIFGVSEAGIPAI